MYIIDKTRKLVGIIRIKYYFSDDKAKAMGYYNCYNTRLQEQSCDYYVSLSEEKKEKKKITKS